MMLFIRVNGEDVAILNAHDMRLLEISGAIRDAFSNAEKQVRRAADTQALIEAARQGDTQTVRRLTRRLKT